MSKVTIERPYQKEAYREYLKLGQTRSLPKLAEVLDAKWGTTAPGLNALSEWSSAFSWQSRVIEDDEIINRRALDRLRDRMAQESERRRTQRLQISDIQMTAVMEAMVVEEEGVRKPAKLLDFHPQTLRAINDTMRLAAETQRLDQGQPTTRLGGPLGPNGEELPAQVAVMGQDVITDLARFVGVLPEETDEEQALITDESLPSLPLLADDDTDLA